MEKKSSNSKYFGLFLIVSSLTCLALWYRYELQPSLDKAAHLQKPAKQKTQEKPKTKLQALWEKDIQEMLKKGIFHKEISSIKKIRLFLLDENLHSQFKGLKAPFKYSSKNGRNLLEISFMSHHSELEKQDKIIIQYNLVSKQTGEMFWEHSRTINIPDGTLAQK